MALNYTTLQTAVLAYSHRADLASMFSTFVTLAEAKINRSVRMARSRAVDTSQTLATGATTLTVPTGAVEISGLALRLVTTTTYDRIKFAPPEKFRMAQVGVEGWPSWWTHEGGAIKVDQAPSQDAYAAITYMTGFDLVNEPLGTNALIEAAPDVYLNAVLAELHRYVQDDERAAYYAQLTAAAVDQLNEQQRRLDASHRGTAVLEVTGMVGGGRGYNINVE